MSAALAQPGIIDISTSQRPSFARLVRVEMRKMADTRAGMWLLITVAAVTVIMNGAILLFGPREESGFAALLQVSGIPQGILLPVLAILLVTQEWGQRTGLTTFALVPRRGRVLWAKFVATVLFTFAALLIAVAVAAVLTPLTGNSDPWDGVSAGWLARVGLGVLIGAVWGFAFGAALVNSAFAIVVYFAAPSVLSIVSEIWTRAKEQLYWVDLGTSSSWLFDNEGPAMTGEQWAQIGTGTLLWVALPLAVGVWRLLRAEVK